MYKNKIDNMNNLSGIAIRNFRIKKAGLNENWLTLCSFLA